MVFIYNRSISLDVFIFLLKQLRWYLFFFFSILQLIILKVKNLSTRIKVKGKELSSSHIFYYSHLFFLKGGNSIAIVRFEKNNTHNDCKINAKEINKSYI